MAVWCRITFSYRLAVPVERIPHNEYEAVNWSVGSRRDNAGYRPGANVLRGALGKVRTGQAEFTVLDFF